MLEILSWWLISTAVGLGFLPLIGRMFSKFWDRGWIFVKAIGLFGSAYLFWLLSCAKVLKFTRGNCFLIVLIGMLACTGAGYYLCKKNKEKMAFPWKKIIAEELVFLGVYLFWCYLISFNPGAYGQEKPMDFAFMTAMMRTDYFPFQDMWYSGETINYYYGGQYFATFLTKLSGVRVGVGYSLMRATIGAFAFVLPLSIVYELIERYQIRVKHSVSAKWCWFSGIVSGIALSMSGNVHYIIYALIVPIVEKIKGIEINNYFYPNSTRYIGRNPVVENDSTIHEFPSYSLVLGDLHAHMINIIFVLVVVALAVAWALKIEQKKEKLNFKEALLQPEIILIGFFTGMFRWMNFWDFPIYFVVGGSVVFFMNIRQYRDSLKDFCLVTAAQAAEAFLVGMAACLPFTMTFDTIASEIKLAYTHSAFYKLMVLWGLPAITVICFIVSCVMAYRKKCKNRDEKAAFLGFFEKIPVEDLVIVLFGLCALGLIVMPEVIYVQDIYPNAPRANTMFKLTYQAYMLFAISMGYALCKGLMQKKKHKWVFVASVAGLSCLLLTAGYLPNAGKSQFGDIKNTERMNSLDIGEFFIEKNFESDRKALEWLNENVSGSPVVLEANGDSYSKYQRVSSVTGLPTVMGWYVHEWLWRNDTEAQNVRSADIKKIYTSTDRAEVEALIEKYQVEYIYIGTLENEKYPDLNHELLQEMGTVAFSDGAETYILKMQ